jgi:ABC-2 type transport system ATP-binding protein
MVTMPATPSNSAPALKIENLSHSYGSKLALDRVGFAVGSGEFTVLLGPNGAGKTTLFSLVTRLYDSAGGAIRIAGFDIRRQSLQALSRIGVVFQQPTLDLDLSVRQNLLYHAALHGMGGKEAGTRIDAELTRLGILERKGDKVRSLSGGYRRRVEIARALLHRPRLLLLDEPTVGLDVAARGAIVAHVHALARDEGIAVLWATHLIDEVEAGDRVIVLHEGRVRANGEVEEVNRQAGEATIAKSFARLTSAPAISGAAP